MENKIEKAKEVIAETSKKRMNIANNINEIKQKNKYIYIIVFFLFIFIIYGKYFIKNIMIHDLLNN